MLINSGQLKLVNKTNTIRKPQTKLKVLNSKQNQQSNVDLNFRIDDDNNQDTLLTDNITVQQNHTNKSVRKKVFTIEVEFEREEELGIEEYSGIVLHVTKESLKAWTRDEVIDDAYDLDSCLLNKEYEVLDTWAIEPKIVKRKKYVKGETIV